jgi:hypothetical protein
VTKAGCVVVSGEYDSGVLVSGEYNSGVVAAARRSELVMGVWWWAVYPNSTYYAN